MTASLERRVVEAGFVLVLVAATAAFHYTRGFQSPFPYVAGSGPFVERGPLHNYLLLLSASATAYCAARGACSALSSSLPASVKSSAAGRRAAIALAIPAAACALHIAAGSPVIGDHVATKWLLNNWERNGRTDLAWCARLFVLLFFWQALFAVVVAVHRTLLSGLIDLVKATGADDGKKSSGKAKGPKVLDHDDDIAAGNGRSGVGVGGNDSSSSGGGNGVGKMWLDTSAPITG